MFTSTTVDSHFHLITIDQVDIQSPPSLGVSE